MTFAGWLTIVLFAVFLTALAFPLGGYMAKVYMAARRVFLSRRCSRLRRSGLLYKLLRVDP